MIGDEGAKGALGKVGEKLRAILEGSKAESARLSQVARIQLDVNTLRRARDRALRDLGERSYRLLRDGGHAIESAGALVEEIAAIDRRIAAKEAEIEGLRRGKDRKATTAGGGTQNPSPEGP